MEQAKIIDTLETYQYGVVSTDLDVALFNVNAAVSNA